MTDQVEQEVVEEETNELELAIQSAFDAAVADESDEEIEIRDKLLEILGQRN